MKIKHLFLSLFATLWFCTVQAQVKVGDNPGTINGGSALEIESTNKGLLMPRVALTTTTTWGLAGTAVAGMSVYNTSAGLTSSNTTYPAAGVGEYYWDGTGWVSKKSGAQSGADNGLTVGYNSAGNVGLGGTLSKNTIIAQGANTLAFTSTATSGTSHFTVDGSTFNVNAVNNNVGIGTANPMGRLNVAQDNYTSSISTSYLTPGVVITGSTTENGFAGPGIYFEGKDNNVGQRVMKVNMTKLTSGVGFLNFQSVSDDGAVSGTNVMSVGINGRVGIGTIAPATKLEVNNGTTAGAIKIVDGTQGANKILTSDANGVGTWQSPADIDIPTPAVYSLQSDISNFLNGVGSGSNQSVPMAQIANSTGGNVTFNSGTNTISLKPGVYQMTFVYEATHDASGCTVSSYIVDFPTGTGNSSYKRIHSTAAHNQGGTSNHGGTISFTTVITGTGYDWQIKLGRGQSGNCSGTGNTLAAGSTQLTVLRY